MRAEEPEGPEGDVPVEWGSDALAELRSRLDLRYIALVPGSSYRGLHDSLVNHLGNERPQMLLCLHEEAAIAIAHGYAKASGKMMGAVVHSNVGLMHASMAMATDAVVFAIMYFLCGFGITVVAQMLGLVVKPRWA